MCSVSLVLSTHSVVSLDAETYEGFGRFDQDAVTSMSLIRFVRDQGLEIDILRPFDSLTGRSSINLSRSGVGLNHSACDQEAANFLCISVSSAGFPSIVLRTISLSGEQA